MDAAEVLEPAEEPFDDVALAVGDGVVAVRMLAVRLRRDDDVTAAVGKPVAQVAGIVGTVGDELARRSGDGEQVARSDEVAGVAGG